MKKLWVSISFVVVILASLSIWKYINGWQPGGSIDLNLALSLKKIDDQINHYEGYEDAIKNRNNLNIEHEAACKVLAASKDFYNNLNKHDENKISLDVLKREIYRAIIKSSSLKDSISIQVLEPWLDWSEINRFKQFGIVTSNLDAEIIDIAIVESSALICKWVNDGLIRKELVNSFINFNKDLITHSAGALAWLNLDVDEIKDILKDYSRQKNESIKKIKEYVGNEFKKNDGKGDIYRKQVAKQFENLITVSQNTAQISLNAANDLRRVFVKQNKDSQAILQLYEYDIPYQATGKEIKDQLLHFSTITELGTQVYEFLKLTNRNDVFCDYHFIQGCQLDFTNNKKDARLWGRLYGNYDESTHTGYKGAGVPTIKWNRGDDSWDISNKISLVLGVEIDVELPVPDLDGKLKPLVEPTDENKPESEQVLADPFYTKEFKLGIRSPTMEVRYVKPDASISDCKKINCRPSVALTRNDLVGLSWQFTSESNSQTKQQELIFQNFLDEIGISELFEFSAASLDFTKSAIINVQLNMPTLAGINKKVNLQLDLLDSKTFDRSYIEGINQKLLIQLVDQLNQDIQVDGIADWKLPTEIKQRDITHFELSSVNPLLFSADVIDPKTNMSFDVVLMVNKSLEWVAQTINIDDELKHASLVSNMTKVKDIDKSIRKFDTTIREVEDRIVEYFASNLPTLDEGIELAPEVLKVRNDARSYFLQRAVGSFISKDNLKSLGEQWGVNDAQKLTFEIGLAFAVMQDMTHSNPSMSYTEAAEKALDLINDPSELKRNHLDVLKKQLSSYMKPSDSLETLVNSVGQINGARESMVELAKHIPGAIELKEVKNDGFKLEFKVGPITQFKTDKTSKEFSPVPIILPESWNKVIQVNGDSIAADAKEHWEKLTALGNVIEEVAKQEVDAVKKAGEDILKSKAAKVCHDTIGKDHIICTNPEVILEMNKYVGGIFNSYLNELESRVLSEVDTWTNEAYQEIAETIDVVLINSFSVDSDCHFRFESTINLNQKDMNFDDLLKGLITNKKAQQCLLANLHEKARPIINTITESDLAESLKSIPSNCHGDLCKQYIQARVSAFRIAANSKIQEVKQDIKQKIIRHSVLMLSEAIDDDLQTVLDWVNAFESMALEYASKTGIPAFIGGVCLKENKINTDSIKPPPCPDGYTFYKDVSEIDFEALGENYANEQIDEFKAKIQDTAKQVCLDNFNYTSEVLADQSLCTALEDPKAFEKAMKEKGKKIIKDMEQEAKEKLDEVIEDAIGMSFAEVEKNIQDRIEGFCKTIEDNKTFKIFGAQVVIDHNCPNPPSSANVKAGFYLFNRYFEIVSGLDINASASDPANLINMKKLVISPRIEAVIAEEITNKVDGMTVKNASFTDNVFRADVLFQPGNLPWPITANIEISDFADFGINIDSDAFLNSALVELGKQLCSNLTPLAELVAESIPFTEVLNVEETTCIKIEDGKEFFDLAALKVGFKLKTDFFDGYNPEVPVEITVANGIKFGDVNLEGPIKQFLDTKFGFGKLKADEPLLETEGGFKLNLIADIKFELGEGALGIILPFTISRDGLEPRGALELNLPGWYPVGIFSFGNLGAKYDIKDKVFGLNAAFSFVEGNVMNRVIRIDGSGEIKIGEKELTINGDLIFSDLLTLASSESKLNFDQRLISTSVSSGPMLKDLIELNGTIRVQDKEPAPFFHATGYGALFGADLAEGKFDMKLTKEFAADFAVDVKMPIGTHQIILKSDKGLKDLAFGSNITEGVDGLAEVGLEINGNAKFVQVIGTAEVKGLKPFSVSFTTESLKGVSLDDILDGMFELKFDLPHFSSNVDLFAQGEEGDVDDNDFDGVQTDIPTNAVKTDVVINIPEVIDNNDVWYDAWREETRHKEVCERIVSFTDVFTECKMVQYKIDVYHPNNKSIAHKVFSNLGFSEIQTRNLGGMIKVSPNVNYALMFKTGNFYVFNKQGDRLIWQGRFDKTPFQSLSTSSTSSSIQQRNNVAKNYQEVNFTLLSSHNWFSGKDLALVYFDEKYFAVESGKLIESQLVLKNSVGGDANNAARILATIINQINSEPPNSIKQPGSSIPFADMVASGIKQGINPSFYLYDNGDSIYCMKYEKELVNGGNYPMHFISDFNHSENKLIGIVATPDINNDNACAGMSSPEIIKDLVIPEKNKHCPSSNSLDDVCGVAFLNSNKKDAAVLFEDDNQMYLRAPGLKLENAPVNHMAHQVNLEGVLIYAQKLEDDSTYPKTSKTELIKSFTGLYVDFKLGTNSDVTVSDINFIEANMNSYPATAMSYKSDAGHQRFRLLDSKVNCFEEDGETEFNNGLSILDESQDVISKLWEENGSSFSTKWPAGAGAIPRPGSNNEWPQPFLEVLANRNFKDKGFTADPLGSMDKGIRCSVRY